MYIEYYLKLIRLFALYYSFLLCHIVIFIVNRFLDFILKLWLLVFSSLPWYLILSFHLYIFQCAIINNSNPNITALNFAYQFSMYIEYYLKLFRSFALYYLFIIINLVDSNLRYNK